MLLFPRCLFWRRGLLSSKIGPVRPLRRSSSSPSTDKARSFKDILKTLRASHPASHLTAFVFLHELTALLPLPLLFYTFHTLDAGPFLMDLLPPEWVQESESKMNRMILYFYKKCQGTSLIDEGSPIVVAPSTLMHAGMAYLAVKLALPLRLWVSWKGTPFIAQRILIPFQGLLRRMVFKRK
jgi:hypothetical protein